MTETAKTDVLIIGAGLAGLAAGQALADAGHKVLLLDKGRSVGGRLATRRLGGGVADHGAQFFTVREDEFRQAAQQWEQAGLTFLWSLGWSRGSFLANTGDGYPRYGVHGGMNKLAKHLAQGQNVRTGTRVAALAPEGDGWSARTEAGETFAAAAVVLTPPVPQSLALLQAGNAPLHPEDRTALEKIAYAPCLAGLFVIDGPFTLPAPGAVQRPAETFPWMADNRQKGISPAQTVVTVHADEAFSRRHYDDKDMEIVENMKAALEPYLSDESHIAEAQVKRWRYSNPLVLHDERCLLAQHLPPLVFAGDAFGGPRVEGAYLSGRAAAQAVQQAG